MKAQGQSTAPSAQVPDHFAGLRVLVVGLGRFGGGVGVTRWLVEQGAHVTVTDSAEPGTLAESVEALAGLNVRWRLGGHDGRDLRNADLVVINPAVVKSRSDLFRALLQIGLPWTTELNLFCERCRGTVIGVTGSYGKSTTCAMLAHAMIACQRLDSAAYTGVYLGGNIGRSLLCDLSSIRPTDLVVLELSSAQLEDLPRIDWTPTYAVITNLSPHHLDRYENYAAYLNAKFNIITAHKSPQALIVGDLDAKADSTLRERLEDGYSRVIHVERQELPLRVPGTHNQANASCVLAVSRQLGLGDEAVRQALATFSGLPHRLEHVRALDDVDYYNDSKSTSPASTVRALEALDRPVVAIVGGQEKAVSLAACARALVDHCRSVVCVGESASTVAQAVGALCRSTDPGFVRTAPSLAEALRSARRSAQPGDAVLFSPGAPSFDAYDNFAHRGREFVAAVNAMA